MNTISDQNSRKKPQLASIDSLEDERRSSIHRSRSFDNMNTSAEANVLVIYTGGTIGMVRNVNNGKNIDLNVQLTVCQSSKLINSVSKSDHIKYDICTYIYIRFK